MTYPATDRTGQRFGALTVLDRAGSITTASKTRAAWRCLCDCGEIVVRSAPSLMDGGRNGYLPSCRGCWLRRIRAPRVLVHKTRRRRKSKACPDCAFLITPRATRCCSCARRHFFATQRAA